MRVGQNGINGRSVCCGCRREGDLQGVSRRDFIGVVGGAALVGLSWSALRAAKAEVAPPPARKPLVVKPLFAYSTYRRRNQTSWRNWGGVETQKDAEGEVGRIDRELGELKKRADFPLEFLPLAAIRSGNEAANARQGRRLPPLRRGRADPSGHRGGAPTRQARHRFRQASLRAALSVVRDNPPPLSPRPLRPPGQEGD